MVPRNLASYLPQPVADDVRRLHIDPLSPDRTDPPEDADGAS